MYTYTNIGRHISLQVSLGDIIWKLFTNTTYENEVNQLVWCAPAAGLAHAPSPSPPAKPQIMSGRSSIPIKRCTNLLYDKLGVARAYTCALLENNNKYLFL